MEISQIFENIICRLNNIENKNIKENQNYFNKEIILIIIQTIILLIFLFIEKYTQ